MSVEHLIVILLLVPFVSAGLIGAFLRRRGELAAAVSLAAAAVVLIGSLYLIFGNIREEFSYDWMTFGEYTVSMGFYFNDLAALLLFVVAVVGFLIHVFSLGYMKDDPGKARYFAGLSLFMFSMMGIVFANNLIMMFIFWELVGLSSFLLINHYYHKPSAAAAAKKAFIVNRLGDFGFLLGIIWSYWHFGTLNLFEMEALVGADPEILHVGIGLLLFCSALGKSGQIPLHVWLPDAMEGPTPVSALIHAATMVAAGIYLLCRIFFLIPPDAMAVIMWVGALTAVLGSLCAITQTDIKKILAYSTISQLGYMVAAFGLGALVLDGETGTAIQAGIGAAMFHLVTHGFFKALLFLGAGSVIHACHHEQSIYRMGGLRVTMPITFATFTIGVLALIGMPGLAGFFSKDAILYLAWANSKAVFVILALTALLTAFYMTRLWLTAFFGEAKSEAASDARENGWVMTGPLVILAIFSVLAGYEFMHPAIFHDIMMHVPHAEGGDFALVAGVSISVLVAGLVAAWLFYGAGARKDRLEQHRPAIHSFLARAFFFDDVYDWYVVKVQQRFSSLINFFDHIVISGLIVRGAAGIIGFVSLGIKSAQTGSLHGYVYWIFLGVVLMWLFVGFIL